MNRSTCTDCHATVIWARIPQGDERVRVDTSAIHPGDPGALMLLHIGPDVWAYDLNSLAIRVATKDQVSDLIARATIFREYEGHPRHDVVCRRAARKLVRA